MSWLRSLSAFPTTSYGDLGSLARDHENVKVHGLS